MIYGNVYLNEVYNESCSIDNIDFILSEAFNNIDSLDFITEDTLAISGPTEPKKWYARIFETIKNAFTKAAQFILKIINDFVDWVTKTYNNTNIKDNIMGKIGKDFTWDKMNKMISQGYKCTLGHLPVSLAFFNLKNTDIAKMFKMRSENIDKNIDAISKCSVADDAEKLYKELKGDQFKKIRNSLNVYKSAEFLKSNIEVMNISADDYDAFTRDYNFAKVLGKQDEVDISDYKLYYNYTVTLSDDKKHYIPSQNDFNSTKQVATTGQSYAKDFKASSKRLIDNFKKEIYEPLERQYKALSVNNNGELSDTEQKLKVEQTYYKAKAEYSLLCMRCLTDSMHESLKSLHIVTNYGIKTFLFWILCSKKYNLA